MGGYSFPHTRIFFQTSSIQLYTYAQLSPFDKLSSSGNQPSNSEVKNLFFFLFTCQSCVRVLTVTSNGPRVTGTFCHLLQVG